MEFEIEPKETDKDVERMLKTWDEVKCKFCKRKISMLDAELNEDGQYFQCKGGCK